MNISLPWLNDYIDLSESPQEIASILTSIGLEVEEIENTRAAFEGIVVARVLSCKPHPNSNRLHVCTVDGGAGPETVVCGAPNVREGQMVVFARVGSTVPRTGMRVERKEIRGVLSNGMICSSYELGIDEDHSGILVLEENAPLGSPAHEVLSRHDVRFVIGITPNRGDALSHIGVARDLSAVLRRPLRYPVPRFCIEGFGEALPIHIEDAMLCSRYSAARIRGVKIRPSPAWLRNAVENVGLRSINNIVDTTNFVMFEIGQPMHAFDLHKLEGPRILVRAAGEGERFTTLDGVERTLPQGAVLICDGEKPVALGGIMGGMNSEISNDTTEVLLESASFNPTITRRTSRRLLLASESSFRFERGTDPSRTVWALQRAIDIITDTAGGEVCGISDIITMPVCQRTVALDPQNCERILGYHVEPESIREILEFLEFHLDIVNGVFHCTVPPFRNDIEREIDLIEEIARISGYDNIPVPERMTLHAAPPYNDEAFRSACRRAAITCGFDEILSPTLIERKYAHASPVEGVIEVLNPVNTERPCLRPSLMPSMMETVSRNLRCGIRTLRIFEIGTIFIDTAPSEKRSFDSIRQKTAIAFALTGYAEERSWYSRERPFDFFDLKGLLTTFFTHLHLENKIRFNYDGQKSSSELALSLEIDGNSLGELKELSQYVRKLYDIDQPVYYAEFDLDLIERYQETSLKFVPVSRYPMVRRDLSFIVPENVETGDIIEMVKSLGIKILRDIALLDVFRHEDFGVGNKSIAITLSMQSDTSTLTDHEINMVVMTVVERIEKTFSASLRSTESTRLPGKG
ncbi:MAG: phenylalanine--tRNA ligase subunit beta [Bacteroidota bacterium]|nr:phenylalanine--tRNA ligase subunit beta [Bacteroidota bacterium]